MPNATVQLNPIVQGTRRPFTGVADEAVENPTVTVTAGDSTATVSQADPKTIKGFFNGDGALGSKSVDIAVDGHIGDGDVEIVTTFNYDVIHKDATTVGFTFGTDEPIPPTV